MDKKVCTQNNPILFGLKTLAPLPPKKGRIQYNRNLYSGCLGRFLNHSMANKDKKILA